jgi:hypothetical protein
MDAQQRQLYNNKRSQSIQNVIDLLTVKPILLRSDVANRIAMFLYDEMKIVGVKRKMKTFFYQPNILNYIRNYISITETELTQHDIDNIRNKLNELFPDTVGGNRKRKRKNKTNKSKQNKKSKKINHKHRTNKKQQSKRTRSRN